MNSNTPSVHEPCCRCGNHNLAMTCSIFNTDWICIKCKEQETFHPMYGEAKHREHLEVLAGNYNYPGIGLPADFQVVRVSK